MTARLKHIGSDQGGTYFDAVLDKDSMAPLFNGVPEETKSFLEDNRHAWETFLVCPGKTMRPVSVEEYLAPKAE